VEKGSVSFKGTAFKRDRKGLFRIDRAGPGNTEITCIFRGQELRERLWAGPGAIAQARFFFDPPIASDPIRVEGRVLAAGIPVVNCCVVLQRSWSDPLYRAKVITRREEVTTTTDSDGNYALEISREGEFEVTLLSGCGYYLPILGPSNLQILEGPFRLDLDTGAAVLTGTVLDAADGSPISGAVVGWINENWMSTQKTDRYGRFHFRHVCGSEVKLRVDALGFPWPCQKVIKDLNQGDAEHTTFRLGEGDGSLKVILSGNLPSSGSRPFDDGVVTVDEANLFTWRFIELDSREPGPRVYLGHGIPPGRKVIGYYFRDWKGNHGGKAQAEIKAGETAEVRIEVE
jgi:hypothetical protein